jgi:2TM family of unknown function (DUF5676)
MPNSLADTAVAAEFGNYRCERRYTTLLSVKTWTWSLSTFFVVSYLLCVGWGLLTPASLHCNAFLEAALPGFHWLTVDTFFLGLVESILYGVYLGVVFVPIHNFFCRLLVRA